MALNKFEKQIQQKLNNREMKPSANSWDRLDAMLSVEEKPKKKGFLWKNIAASFMVFASIGFYFYNQSEVKIPVKEETIIVEVEDRKIENIEEIKGTKIESLEEVLVDNDIKSAIRQQKSGNRNQITNKSQETLVINQGVSTINQSKENANNLISEIKNQKTKGSNRYVSAEKLLAEVSNVKFETKTSEQEVRNVKKVISVNANTLLSNAESEIYQSFRENALERLNKNYNVVKTVLANRNYENEY